MPFQSEKQRRYLWANEPEIARDWTDTYGSRIRRDNGGGMGWADQGGMKNYLGEQPMVNAPQNWRAGPNTPPTELAYVTGPEKDLILQANMHGSLANGPNEGPSGIMSLDTQGDYTPDRSPGGTSGGGGGGDREAENIATQQAARQKAVLTGKIQKDPLTGNWEAGRNLGRGENVMGLGLGPGQGPQLGLTRSRIGGGLGNWASQFAGSKIGGGLGSMLFGPWGALLGALFGRGVGKRGYQAYQTKDKKESLQDILLGENNILSSMFNKRINEQPRGEGIETIDIKDKYLRNQPQRSAKDFIDLDKSYSEFDTIPSEYKGANLAKFISNKKDFPLHGKVVGDWDKGLGDFEYEQPEEWSTQDFPVRSDFYPGNVTKTYETGTGQNTLADWLGTTKYSDTRW